MRTLSLYIYLNENKLSHNYDLFKIYLKLASACLQNFEIIIKYSVKFNNVYSKEYMIKQISNLVIIIMSLNNA